jgi:hypothetical protein
MRHCTIKFTANFFWVEVLKISQSKFLKYKKDGIPSEELDFYAWEEYVDDLECNSESCGIMEFSKIIKVDIEADDNGIINNLVLSIEDINFLEMPVSQGYEEGGNYLVRIQSKPDSVYLKKIAGVFDKDKLLLKIRSECFPGDEVINTFSATYDGEFFYNESQSELFKDSIVYLVDSKGNKFPIESQLNSIRNNTIDPIYTDQDLTNWYLASISPVRIGRYEIEASEKVVWPFSPLKYAEWNGICWVNDLGAALTVLRWRGLKSAI